MADEKKTGWAAVGEAFADLVKQPKQLILTVFVLASFIGYDLTVPAERVGQARKKLEEANARMDELEKLIADLKAGQVKTLQALNK